LPALDVSQKAVVPPTDCMAELPLLTNVAWSAVEELWNCTIPPCPPLCVGPAVTTVAVPAVALFANVSVPLPPAPLIPTIKFWSPVELLIMPAPLIVNAKELSVIVNALAPELNTMLFTVIRLEREMPVMLDVANVAVSVGEFGTVPGVQLAAVFQSPVTGAAFHVALPAKLLPAAASKNSCTTVITASARAPNIGSRRSFAPSGKATRVQFGISFIVYFTFRLPAESRRSPPTLS